MSDPRPWDDVIEQLAQQQSAGISTPTSRAILALNQAWAEAQVFREGGIKVFASPCEAHSGIDALPFEEWNKQYGARCVACDVQRIQELDTALAHQKSLHGDTINQRTRLMQKNQELEGESGRLMKEESDESTNPL